MRAAIVIFVTFLCFPVPGPASDWPQFRGPSGMGCAEAQTQNLPQRWDALLHAPRWHTPIPGSGWSSPIVIGDRIWLTAAEQTALTDEQRSARLAEHPYGVQEFQVHGAVTILAMELDAHSGKLLRRIELFANDCPAPIHIFNSYASPTPVTDGRNLYCHFGSLGTVALDLRSGDILWQRRFELDDITGPGTSPVLCDKRLILACDGVDQQFVIALDTASGNTVWCTKRPPVDGHDGKLRRAFSTPLVIEHVGRKQIIAPAAQWVVAYDPATGDELWRVNFGTGHAVVPRPVYQDGIVYVCTGYPEHDLWAIRVDGEGDVTGTHVLWKYLRQAPELSSPLLVGQELYFVTSIGVAVCLDAATGETVWQHRLGGTFSASPLFADAKLYFTNQMGVTTIIRPGRDYHEIARNELFGETRASFAVWQNALLVRTDAGLYCIGDASARGRGRADRTDTTDQSSR